MTLRLPDIGGQPVTVIGTYGNKSAVVLEDGLVLVLPTSALVEDRPADVPAGVAGFQIGGRHAAEVTS